ncbi:MAG: hypothetical protein DYH13_09960 [Alphaproteobacteria bacterium PRO2]|nr:hypothetical protein [Alphaproteobacteria bacterium PRO2]
MAKLFNSKSTPGRELPPEIPQPELQKVVVPGYTPPPPPAPLTNGIAIVIVNEPDASKDPTFH